MTDQKKPETLEDKDLDEAQGGLVINLSVGVKDQDGAPGVWKAPAGIEAAGDTGTSGSATPLLQKALSRNEE